MAKLKVLALAIVLLASGLVVFSNQEIKAENNYLQHEPIYINGNENFTAENGVSSGNGTKENPYIIENWEINASKKNGIEIRNTDKYFVIRNCYVHDCKYSGIVFSSVENGKIEFNEITKNEDGIVFGGGGCMNNTVSNNTITFNNNYGIGLEHVIDLHINNKISYNNISNNKIGIYMITSLENIITFNNITSNIGYGIQREICKGGGIKNSIHHNNFINNNNNTTQASCYGRNIADFWNDTKEGNYWSDYNGTDNNSDGVGDTPYNISYSDDKDYYPLMQPYENAGVQKPNSVYLSYSDITTNSIKLSWTKNNDNDFKNYTLFISQDNMTWDFLTSISDINTTSYNATNLNSNTTYYFKIRVYDNGNLYNDSNIIQIKTLEEQQPPIQNQIPTITSFTSSKTKIKVNEETTLNVSAIDFDGTIISYFFDFGDGANSSWISQNSTTHKYEKEGNYTVKVKVKDNQNTESGYSKLQITVEKEDKKSEPKSFIPSISIISIIALISIISFLHRKINKK